MNVLSKQPLLAALLAASFGSAFAAGPDPLDCPCLDDAVDLVSETQCTDNWGLRRFGKGRDVTKLLSWIEGDTCHWFRLDKWNGEVRVVDGEASGLGACDVNEGTIDCTVGGLDDMQVRGCEVAQRELKREVQHLPDCQ